MEYLHALRKALAIILLGALASACSASQGAWPNLGDAPEAATLEGQAPVRIPDPARVLEPIAASEARGALEAMPARLKELKSRIDERRKLYAQARESAESLGDPTAIRTAQFHLSRLSALETELSRRLQTLERIAVSNVSAEVKAQAVTLRRQAQARRERLNTYLIDERQALAMLSKSR